MSSKKSRASFTRLLQGNVWENLALVILAFYPLRHISQGLDLWDTGYNYANFQYFGTEHMDPMWLFSTYLANVTGNLLTGLPKGDTLMGMNLYTGLFVSAMALAGYFFCTRKIKMPKPLVFIGEMAAVSLCWCPTALLYNYLTYLLFLLASVFLYLGLTGDKKNYLMAAGVLLGTNVLVRFSNLPEAGMILAVWAYDFILWRKEKKETPMPEGFWHRIFRHTLWCLAGYAAALAVLLHYIHIRYGLDHYVRGIRRLFAMTDKAADYKPAAMIMGVVGTYRENLYWVIRIGIIVLGGMALFAAADRMRRLRTLSPRTSGVSAGEGRKQSGMPGAVYRGIHIGWMLVCGAMLWWLYDRQFCSTLFYSYDSMLRPGILFLMLTMFLGAIRIFSKKASAEEKLLSGMLILIILLTSLGSNNDVYPSLNNLFLAAPYTFWQSWRFIRCTGNKRLRPGNGQELRKAGNDAGNHKRSDSRTEGLLLAVFPAKGVLAAFLGLCLFQFAGFGMKFVFAEATGVRDVSAAVDNNEILRNIGMSPEKARWMEEISAFVRENDLEGQEVILYGNIPSLSYYLQMPAAFNPWSDLDSYGFEVMESDLKELAGQIREKGKDRPVIIVEHDYVLYEEEGMEVLEAAGVPEENRKKIAADPKWPMLTEFMEAFGYEQTFRNEKFALYQGV